MQILASIDLVCVPQLCLLYFEGDTVFILSGQQVVCNIKQLSILPKCMVIDIKSG